MAIVGYDVLPTYRHCSLKYGEVSRQLIIGGAVTIFEEIYSPIMIILPISSYFSNGTNWQKTRGGNDPKRFVLAPALE
jgi:hypothetical protein